MTRNKLTELIDMADLSAYVEPLCWLVRDSIRLVSHQVDINQLDLGESRIGGTPDLPRDLDWPEWESSPLSFIAQIRLSDLSLVQEVEIVSKTITQQLSLFDFEPQLVTPRETVSIARNILPETGILYFFSFDDTQNEHTDWVVNRNAWRVIYHESEEAAELLRKPFPFKGNQIETEPMGHLAAQSISFWREATLPPIDAYELQPLEMTGREQEDYRELLHDLEQAQFPDYATHYATHRLLGYPEQIQNNIQEECQLLSEGHYHISNTGSIIPVTIDIAPSANELTVLNWKFLLQIQNDWGGVLYYWIPSAALAQQDFSKAWVILQYD